MYERRSLRPGQLRNDDDHDNHDHIDDYHDGMPAPLRKLRLRHRERRLRRHRGLPMRRMRTDMSRWLDDEAAGTIMRGGWGFPEHVRFRMPADMPRILLG